MKTVGRSVLIVMGVLVGIGVLVVGGILLSRTGWGMFGYGPGMMDGRFFGYRFGLGGVFWVILQVFFWAAIIGLGIWLISRLASGGRSYLPPGAPHESALDILKKRYARGEITKEQFDEMRRNLET